MRYHFKVHKEKAGYWAECVELTGCITQADSKKELLENLQEVLNLYLDEPEHTKVIFPPPDKHLPAKAKNLVSVPVEPKIAFAMLLRQAKLKK